MRSRHVTTTGVVEVPQATSADALCTEDGLVWVDLDHTDERGMALLPQILDARLTDVEDCHARTPVPKLHLYPDHHYTAINGLSRGSNGRLYFQPLKVFQNPHLVITVLGPTSTALPRDAARRELDAVHRRLDGGHFRPTNSLELITAIRREMMGAPSSTSSGTPPRVSRPSRNKSSNRIRSSPRNSSSSSSNSATTSRPFAPAPPKPTSPTATSSRQHPCRKGSSRSTCAA